MSDDLSKVDHANGGYDPDCAACRSGGGVITLTADQAAMLRKVLAAIGGCVGTTIGHQTFFVPAQVVQDARDALALLPKPVDGDLVECRKVLAERYPDSAQLILAGHWDKNAVGDSLACVQHIRALERDSREG